VDRSQSASFLRVRREALRPADVGLVPGARRRTPGLRREEVALLATMSTDYYERLEQARGPHPPEALVACLARALRLSTDERDHLYVLAGHAPPAVEHHNAYVDPGLMFVLDSLTTIPAVVTDGLTTVLAQNPLAAALFGPMAGTGGRADNTIWRWSPTCWPRVRSSWRCGTCTRSPRCGPAARPTSTPRSGCWRCSATWC
jgi:hypothetical protein